MASPLIGGKFFDTRAVGLAPGAALYTYDAGTLTPINTYTDAGGGSTNANPVILNVYGQADVFLGDSSYRMRLYTDTIGNGGALLWDEDNISPLSTSTGSASVGFIQSGFGAVARTAQDKMRETVSILDFGGAPGIDCTAAINLAMAAISDGAAILFPAASDHYLFSQLVVNKTIWFFGDGWNCEVQAGFGNAGYLSTATMSGSVLRSTYTGAGNAITCTTLGKGTRLKSLAIVGPGSGTSVAIAFGSLAAYQVLGKWDDVLVANFYAGIALTNVEDWTFESIRIRGMSTYGWLLQSGGATVNTNQIVFCNPEVQYCGSGVLITEAGDILFDGGLIQNCTTPIKLTPSANGRIAGISIFKTWFENNTTNIELDLTNGGVQFLLIDGTKHNGAMSFFTLTNPSNQTVTRVQLQNVDAAGLALDLSPGASVGPAYALVSGKGNQFASITRNNATADTDVMEISGSAVYDPPNLADGAGATTTVTATGAALGDFARASFSLDLQGITVTAWVSSANTVSVRFQNESGGALDLLSGTLRAIVSKV